MLKYDIVIIGAGIVGLATAYNLCKKYPNKKIAILEKENDIALHQTGRNSGVIHSGIYYKPGSLKAINCHDGKILLEKFCIDENIKFDKCGKIIVAVDEKELEQLDVIYQRGLANQVKCEIIDKNRIKEFEPHASGIKAIYVPETGIIDYKEVCKKLSEIIKAHNNDIFLREKVIKIDNKDEIIVSTTKNEYLTKYLVNCAGLYSDLISKYSNIEPDIKIIPFRGEYFQLKENKSYLCKNLIYPVPDPSFPFLGVHFTRMINGGVECGPNAVLAFAREGYHKTDINFSELYEILTYKGMHHVMAKYWKTGLGEMWRSFNKSAFTSALQKLIPEIKSEDLIPIDSGIRAQAVSYDGKILDDFYIKASNKIINVLNSPSPAATSSFNIGKSIMNLLENKF